MLVAVPDGTCPYDTVRLLGMSVSIFMCVCVCASLLINENLHFRNVFYIFLHFLQTSQVSVRFDSIRIGVWVWLPRFEAIISFCCALTCLLFSFSYFVAFWGQCGSAWKTILLFSNAFCCCSATAAAEVDCVIVGWAGRGQQDCRGGGGGGGGGGKWKTAKVKNAYAPTCHTHTHRHTLAHTQSHSYKRRRAANRATRRATRKTTRIANANANVNAKAKRNQAKI